MKKKLQQIQFGLLYRLRLLCGLLRPWALVKLTGADSLTRICTFSVRSHKIKVELF